MHSRSWTREQRDTSLLSAGKKKATRKKSAAARKLVEKLAAKKQKLDQRSMNDDERFESRNVVLNKIKVLRENEGMGEPDLTGAAAGSTGTGT